MSPLWARLMPGLYVRVDGIEVSELVGDFTPARWSVFGEGTLASTYAGSRQAMAAADRLYPVVLQRVGQRALMESL